MERTTALTWLARLTTRTRSAVAILIVAITGVGAVMALGGGSGSSSAPNALPESADSVQAAAAVATMTGGDSIPAVAIVARDGEPITAEDRAWLKTVSAKWGEGVDGKVLQTGDSRDGEATLLTIPVPSSVSGLDLTDLIDDLRQMAADPPAGLTVQLTGGAAFAGDLSSAFSGADLRLLLVTALVVAVLLMVTYRSPVLWLVPLLVIAIADRTAMVLNERIGVWLDAPLDGSTNGITSVLVFGAGANYALLLISRYREELYRSSDTHTALARAVRGAVPAIVASNLTVVLSMLVLLAAVQPSAQSLGLAAAVGLIVALLFGIFVLPAALALCGRGLFWPFIPRPGEGPQGPGAWHRMAQWVADHARVVLPVTLAGLAVLVLGLNSLSLGLSTTEKFRIEAESVQGLETIEQHFPAGSSDPVRVLTPPSEQPQVAELAKGVEGVVSVTAVPAEPEAEWAMVLVTLNEAPGTDGSIDSVRDLREVFADEGAHALVGGTVAEDVDARDAATHDLKLVVPLILLVVLVLLIILLRSLVAPVVLLLATLVSTAAAFGLGVWVSKEIFGFPALEVSTPLYVFLFLVALGIDYTIFLVTRAREEAETQGTVQGMVEAVGHTGAVITSAGVVLAAVFAVLGVLPLITLTQIGIIVGLGILLDTFVVRTLVVPAAFALLGDRVWWPSKFPTDAND